MKNDEGKLLGTSASLSFLYPCVSVFLCGSPGTL
jgi:hypothetical protein